MKRSTNINNTDQYTSHYLKVRSVMRYPVDVVNGNSASQLSIRTNSVFFHLSWMGWTSVAVLYMVESSMSEISYMVVISLVFSTLLIYRAPLQSLYLLPLPMMIGPVILIPVTENIFITAGDLYALFFITRTIFMKGIHLKNFVRILLLIGTFMIIISTAFSLELGSSVVGLIKIIQYALLVRGTIVLINSSSNCRNLLTAWIFITTLCSIMMLWNFYNGRPLMINWNDEMMYSVDLMRDDVLFRPTFFYTNIFIPLGLSVLYSIINIVIKVESSSFTRKCIISTIPVNIIALIMNNTKAMLIPIAILSGLILLKYSWSFIIRPSSIIGKIIVIALLIGVSVWSFTEYFITVPQLSALSERLGDHGSVVMRWSVWTAVLPKMLDNPLRLLVGYGPQATTRQLETTNMQNMLTGSRGNIEGSFDSTIVGFLIEYGIIITSAIILYIALWFYQAWKCFKLTKEAFIAVLSMMLIALVIAHFFQQYGLSPPGLMALQLFAYLPTLKKAQQKVL